MGFKKRHVFLILLAILPFIKLVHQDDFCFGVVELLIIAGLSIVFVIAFLVVSFYDLYNLSIKKLRFNFIPLIIATIFTICILLGVKFHNKPIFKNKTQSFKNKLNQDNSLTLILFDDTTFEFKEKSIEYTCTKKGNYYFKNDTLYLKKNNKNLNNTTFDSIYYFNNRQLISKNNPFKIFSIIE